MSSSSSQHVPGQNFPLEEKSAAGVFLPSTSSSPPAQPVCPDTRALTQRVHHYLKTNQIQYSRFASLVLGVSQGRLSFLLGKPRPYQELGSRVKALYDRMQLWMDTRATYGNNPHLKMKGGKSSKVRPARAEIRTAGKGKRARSLFEVNESLELLVKEEDPESVESAVQSILTDGLNVESSEHDQVWEEQVLDVLGGESVSVMVVQADFEVPGACLGYLPEGDLFD